MHNGDNHSKHSPSTVGRIIEEEETNGNEEKEKRRQARRQKKIDVWWDYFESIKSVCPWSLQSYKKGLLEIQPYFEYRPLGDLEARVYIYHITSPQLEQVMEQLNDQYPDEEWLFSHPSEGGHSAPVPCLIQQSHQHLESIRQRLKNPT